MNRLRQSLSTELFRLETHPDVVGHITVSGEVFNDENPTAFDDLDVDPDSPELPEPERNADSGGNENVIQPERRPVILPSTHILDNEALCQEELKLRIKQATRYLAAIREAVAEKSFQYTHVMRSAPSQGVRTRSRGVIAKNNDRIAFSCRIYARAREAMIRLRADDNTLIRFRNLLKEDVSASTAILNPNIPGSSNRRLSWIWQTGPSASGPDTMRECMSSHLGSDRDLTCNFSSTCTLATCPGTEK